MNKDGSRKSLETVTDFHWLIGVSMVSTEMLPPKQFESWQEAFNEFILRNSGMSSKIDIKYF